MRSSWRGGGCGDGAASPRWRVRRSPPLRARRRRPPTPQHLGDATDPEPASTVPSAHRGGDAATTALDDRPGDRGGGRRRGARGVRSRRRAGHDGRWHRVRAVPVVGRPRASSARSGLMFVTDLGDADGMAFRYESPHSGTLLDEEHGAAAVDRVLRRRSARILDAFDMEPCIGRPVPDVPHARRFPRRDRDVPGWSRRPRHGARQHPRPQRPPLR